MLQTGASASWSSNATEYHPGMVLLGTPNTDMDSKHSKMSVHLLQLAFQLLEVITTLITLSLNFLTKLKGLPN